MIHSGIICEYNPFHNGHKKQIDFVKERGRAVCLMSGNFVQRGEPAMIDKYHRAKAAVLCGADMVFELPLIYALSSAEGFADGGVEIFSRLGCVDALCFGSEGGDGEALLDCARLLLSPEFPPELKRQLGKGLSFPKARELAIENIGGNSQLLQKPNNILGIEYCKALLKRSSPIQPVTLLRDGDYHGGQDPQNPSASFLRQTGSWEGYMPPQALEVFTQAATYTLEAGERAVLGRLRAMEEGDFAALPYGSEGLWKKLMTSVRTSATVSEILENTKSKRYPLSRLKRMLLCAYLGISEEDLSMDVPYLRVLAMGPEGQKLLAQLRKSSTIPILHPGDKIPDSPYARLERRAEDLYQLFAKDQLPTAGLHRKARLFRSTDSSR